jgi:hypothetical protein
VGGSIENEYNQLINTGTFKWVQHSPPEYKPIGSKLVCHEKLDGEGDVYQHKICLVTWGFSQIPDFNFHVTHSAVAKYSTLCALLAIAMCENMELHQVDVVGAYLQGDLDKEIYMTPPARLNIPGKKGWCLRLHKPLYSLKQVGRQWKKAQWNDGAPPLHKKQYRQMSVCSMWKWPSHPTRPGLCWWCCDRQQTAQTYWGV